MQPTYKKSNIDKEKYKISDKSATKMKQNTGKECNIIHALVWITAAVGKTSPQPGMWVCPANTTVKQESRSATLFVSVTHNWQTLKHKLNLCWSTILSLQGHQCAARLCPASGTAVHPNTQKFSQSFLKPKQTPGSLSCFWASLLWRDLVMQDGLTI